MNNDLSNTFGDIIYAYTRKQAIDDGVLIDVSTMAQEAGILFPVAVTPAIWYEYILPDNNLSNHGQSTNGRLWDILWMFRSAAAKSSGSLLFFEVNILQPANTESSVQLELVILKGHCGPGDQGEPVITIMRPDED